MSADNGIYILKLKDEFRIMYASAIDNLYYDTTTDKYCDEPQLPAVYDYFCDAIVCCDYADAMELAHVESKKWPFLEYGISTIDMSKYTWQEIKNSLEPFSHSDPHRYGDYTAVGGSGYQLITDCLQQPLSQSFGDGSGYMHTNSISGSGYLPGDLTKWLDELLSANNWDDIFRP